MGDWPAPARWRVEEGVPESTATWEAAGGDVWIDHRVNERLELCRDEVFAAEDALGRAMVVNLEGVAGEELLLLGPLKWGAPDDDLVHSHPERPDVAKALVVGDALCALGREVLGRAPRQGREEGPRARGRLGVELGKPKVAQNGRVVGREEDVGRLDVIVGDLVGVEEVYGRDQLDEVVLALGFGQCNRH